MYLTRMRLNESNPNTAKALASPHIFHGTVERCFGGERKRNLWRIDHLNHQLYLMLLSPDKPDLSAAAAQFGMLGADCPWETKIVYSFAGKNNSRQCLAFPFGGQSHKKLCVRTGKERKSTCSCLCASSKEWLQTRAAHNGFR